MKNFILALICIFVLFSCSVNKENSQVKENASSWTVNNIETSTWEIFSDNNKVEHKEEKLSTSYTIIAEKSFFYNEINDSEPRKAYVMKWDIVEVDNTKSSDYKIFVTYVASNGKTTSGYIKKSDIAPTEKKIVNSDSTSLCIQEWILPNKLDLDWTKGKKVTFSYKWDCKTTKTTNIEWSENVNIWNSEYSILNMLAMDGFGVWCAPNNPKNKNIQNGKYRAEITYSSTTDCMGNIQKTPYISISIDEWDEDILLILGWDNIKNLDEEIILWENILKSIKIEELSEKDFSKTFELKISELKVWDVILNANKWRFEIPSLEDEYYINFKNKDSCLPDNGRHSIECIIEKIAWNDILWKLEEWKSTCFEADEDGNEACNNYTRNIKFKTNIISRATTIISDVSNCVFVDYDGTKKKCE